MSKTMVSVIIIIIFLSVIFFAPLKTYATTTHVSPGDDVATIVANANEGDTILFAPGTYDLDDPIAPVVDNLTLEGSGASVTTLNVDNNAIEIRSGIENLVIEGFTITSVSGGDGIYCNVYTGIATGTISNNIITSNNVVDNYIGIYLARGCSFEIYDNTIYQSSRSGIAIVNISATNNIYNNDITGGMTGIDITSNIFNTSNISIYNNTISGNDFGGIYAYNVTFSVHHNDISNNTNVGGIALANSTVQIYANKIIENQSSYGGGIYMAVTNEGSQVYNNYIYKNSATHGPGGGIYSAENDTPIYNNTIVDNTASGNLTPSSIEESFEENLSQEIQDKLNSLDENMHILVQKDSVGGGVYFTSQGDYSPAFYNNIVWGNPDSIYYVGGTTPIFSYNDFDEEPIYSPEAFVGDEGGNIYLNPLLTGYIIGESSPCIDAGTSNNAPSDDIDGNLRPLRDGIDIGAYELPAVTPTPSPSPSLTILPVTGANTNNYDFVSALISLYIWFLF